MSPAVEPSSPPPPPVVAAAVPGPGEAGGVAPGPGPRPRRPRRGGRWGPVALACVLLVGSGGLRLREARRVEAYLRQGRLSPVPLAGVPLELGPWRGRPEPLDPQIARLTGQTDHIFRTYVDTRTGVALDVIILYGPAV